MAGRNQSRGSRSSNGVTQSKTDQTFEDFQNEVILDDLENAVTEHDNAQQSLNQAKKIHQVKTESWDRAVEFLDEYTNIQRQIALNLSQHNDEFTNTIKSAKVKRDEVRTKLTDVITSFKTLSKKLGEAKELACKVEQVAQDTCNQAEFRMWNRAVELDGKIDAIINQIMEAYEASKKNIDLVVKVAGTEAQLNIESLDTMYVDISARVEGFKEDIIQNLEFGRQRDDQTRNELDSAIKNVAAKEDDLYFAELTMDGLQTVKDHTEPNGKRPKGRSIEEIIEASEENFEPLDY